MRPKSLGITAALIAGLALGAVFGPTLRGTSASAQTPTPGQTQTATPGQAQPATPSNSLWNLFLDQLAAKLNIQRSALDSAITSAGTSTADTAVQQGTLTQAQADALKSRIQAGDLGALWGGGRGGMKGNPAMRAVQQAIFDAAAKALNLSADQLRTQLSSGQTLAQIAQAQGTTEQAVLSAALAAGKTQLDQAVAAGTLTQAQANSFYSELQQRGASLLAPRGGHGGRHGAPGQMPQAPGTQPAPSASPSTSSSATT